MSAQHIKGMRRLAKARVAATPRKTSALAATARFVAVSLLAVAAVGIMTAGAAELAMDEVLRIALERHNDV